MGRVAALLEFVRAVRGSAKVSDAKVDYGGGDIRTAEHFADSGDDSFPLPTDFVVTVAQAGTGRVSAVGWIDPINEQKSTAGDKRIYARDAATGAQVVELWLKSDGTATLANALGSLVLLADGTVNINGVTIDKDGNVVIPTSLMLAGKEIAGHAHTQPTTTANATVQGNTGANI